MTPAGDGPTSSLERLDVAAQPVSQIPSCKVSGASFQSMTSAGDGAPVFDAEAWLILWSRIGRQPRYALIIDCLLGENHMKSRIKLGCL